MAQLRANDFVYDGKKLSDFGFQVVETDTGNTTQVVGANRTLTTTNTLGGESLITEIKQTNGSFEIKICKMNKYQEVQPITPHDMDRLNLWLFNPKNYRPLMPLVDGEQGEIVYYALFTSANATYLNGDIGYLSLTFVTDGNHAYGVTQETTIEVETKKTFYLTLLDNISDYYYVDVDIEARGNEVSITNDTLGDSMRFDDLTTEEYRNIRVYGQDMMFMVSKLDPKLNIREKSNKTFLRLKYGKNKITINGAGTYKFLIEPKIAIR